MNWKIPAISVWVAVSFTNASAQTELPNQWINEQMLVAKLDRTPPSGVSGVAIDATPVKPESLTRASAGTSTGAPTVQPKDMPRAATNSTGTPVSIAK